MPNLHTATFSVVSFQQMIHYINYYLNNKHIERILSRINDLSGSVAHDRSGLLRF